MRKNKNKEIYRITYYINGGDYGRVIYCFKNNVELLERGFKVKNYYTFSDLDITSYHVTGKSTNRYSEAIEVFYFTTKYKFLRLNDVKFICEERPSSDFLKSRFENYDSYEVASKKREEKLQILKEEYKETLRKEITDFPERPKKPTGSILREFFPYPLCKFCGSSVYYKFIIPTSKCINTECKNYYQSLPYNI